MINFLRMGGLNSAMYQLVVRIAIVREHKQIEGVAHSRYTFFVFE